MSGFYLMYRGWSDSDVFANEPHSERDAWVWIIEHAAWTPTSARVKGAIVPLERGQLCFAQRFLAEKWQWSKSRVDRFLKRLVAENMISVCSKNGAVGGARSGHSAGQGQSIITVCNYAKYQIPVKEQRGNNGATTGQGEGQKRGNSGAKNNEGNTENEEISPTDSSIGKPTADDRQALIPLGEVVYIASPAAAAFDAYQAMRRELKPAARLIELTDGRRKGLENRLADLRRKGISWDEVLARVRASPFLRGDAENSSFFAEIDWLLKPGNLRKVIEGSYDGPNSASPIKRAPVRGSPIDSLSVAIVASGLGGPR